MLQKKTPKLINLLLVLSMVFSTLPEFAVSAASNTYWAWNVANITASNGKYSVSKATGDVNSANNVTVYGSNNQTAWTELAQLTTSQTRNAYTYQYVKIEPASGYYVKYVAVACNDGTDGLNCTSVGSGDAYVSEFDTSSNAVIIDTNASGFAHGGRQAPYHILIQLAERPENIGCAYEAGTVTLNGSSVNVSDYLTGTIVSSAGGITNGTSVGFWSATTVGVDLVHTVLSPTVGISDAENGAYLYIDGHYYQFSGWNLTLYDDAEGYDSAYPTFGTALISSAISTSAVTLTTHALFTAQWTEVTDASMMSIEKTVTIDGTEYSSGSVPSVNVGDTLTYTVKITNTGQVALYNVTVDDQMFAKSRITVTDTNLPEGVTYTEAVKDGDAIGTFTISSIAVGAAVTITYTYTAVTDDAGTNIYNLAIATASDGTTARDDSPYVPVNALSELTIRIASNAVTYIPSTEQTGYDYAASGNCASVVIGLKDGHYIESVTGYKPASGTDAGVYYGDASEAVVKIVDGDGNDVTAQYDITVDAGYLDIDPLEIIVSVVGDTEIYVYDGTEKTAEGFTVTGITYNGTSHTISIASTNTDSAQSAVIPFSSVLDGSDDFLTVFTDDAIAKGTAAGIYDMGLTDKNMESSLDSNGNYEVRWRVIDGELEIYDASAKLAAIAQNVTTVYDGAAHPINNYAVYYDSTGTGGANRTDVTSENDTTVSIEYFTDEKYENKLSGTPTDAGTYYAVVSASYKADESHTYTAEAYATITINPATLYVSTGSETKTYDGTPLTRNYSVVTGMVGDEKVTVKVTGSQTNVGSSSNTYELNWDDAATTAKESNYTVSNGTIGTLTVTRLAVSFNGDSAEYVYTGDTQSVTTFATTLDTSKFAYTGLEYSASGKDVGEYTGAFDKASDFAITLDGTDVTDNFDVSFTVGTLIIRTHRGISVSKTPAETVVLEGEDIVWYVTVYNLGMTNTAYGLSLGGSVAYPDGSSYDDADIDYENVTTAPLNISAANGIGYTYNGDGTFNLAPQTSATFTVTLPADRYTDIGEYVNSVSVKQDAQETPIAEGTSEAVSVVDIHIEKSVENTTKGTSGTQLTAEVGDELTYRIRVENLSSTAAANAVVVDEQTNHHGDITLITNDVIYDGDKHTFTIPSIAANSFIVIVYTYTIVDEDFGYTLNNVARLQGEEADPEDPDAWDETEISVGRLNVYKTADHSSAKVGDGIKYTVTVVNNYTSALSNISLTDTMPNGDGEIALDTLPSNVTKNSDGSFTIDDLAAGGSVAINYTYTASADDAGKTLQNIAEASADNPESLSGQVEVDVLIFGYSVIYTDGVDYETVFDDQVTEDITYGAQTPEFVGTPTRAGYTFKGWTPDVSDTVTGDAVYTAVWEENTSSDPSESPSASPEESPSSSPGASDKKHTVTYTDGVDGETVFDDQVTDNIEDGTQTPEFVGIPTRDGFIFVGWSPSVSENVTEDAVYTALWEADSWHSEDSDNPDDEPSGEGGDGIPDKYQVLIKYESANTSRGTVSPSYEVITLTDSGGNYIEAGDVTAVGSTASRKSGYSFKSWTFSTDADGEHNADLTKAALTDFTITGVKGGDEYTFTASFRSNGGGGGGSSTSSSTPTPEPTEEAVSDSTSDNSSGSSGDSSGSSDNSSGASTPMLNTEEHTAYIIGYPDGYVRPETSITRAEVATIFFRLLTDDARSQYWSQSNAYSDVAGDSWYNNAVSTLSNMGIVEGYPDGTFRPDSPVTRAELTKIAASFFDTDADGYVYDSEFSDITGDEWYASYIEEAVAVNIISGYEDGTFKPAADITRAETCAIVNRTLGRTPEAENILDESEMNIWPDNPSGAWYYTHIQEATNSHDYTITETGGEETEVWTEKTEERNWSALEYGWSTAYSEINNQ